MLWSSFASCKHFLDPAIRHPLPKKIGHTAHKYCASAFLRVVKEVISAKCGLESKRIRRDARNLHMLFRVKFNVYGRPLCIHLEQSLSLFRVRVYSFPCSFMIYSKCAVCIAASKAIRNSSGVTIRASVQASCYWVPCAFSPLYFCLVHSIDPFRVI